MPVSVRQNVITKVVKKHFTTGFTVLGLQAHDQCYCGNSYGKLGVSEDKDCDLPCSGNPKQICGGYFLNSVYAIDEGIVHCLLVTINMPFLNIRH